MTYSSQLIVYIEQCKDYSALLEVHGLVCFCMPSKECTDYSTKGTVNFKHFTEDLQCLNIRPLKQLRPRTKIYFRDHIPPSNRRSRKSGPAATLHYLPDYIYIFKCKMGYQYTIFFYSKLSKAALLDFFSQL